MANGCSYMYMYFFMARLFGWFCCSSSENEFNNKLQSERLNRNNIVEWLKSNRLAKRAPVTANEFLSFSLFKTDSVYFTEQSFICHRLNEHILVDQSKFIRMTDEFII